MCITLVIQPSCNIRALRRVMESVRQSWIQIAEYEFK